jgi:hypothetical protein
MSEESTSHPSDPLSADLRSSGTSGTLDPVIAATSDLSIGGNLSVAARLQGYLDSVEPPDHTNPLLVPLSSCLFKPTRKLDDEKQEGMTAFAVHDQRPPWREFIFDDNARPFVFEGPLHIGTDAEIGIEGPVADVCPGIARSSGHSHDVPCTPRPALLLMPFDRHVTRDAFHRAVRVGAATARRVLSDDRTSASLSGSHDWLDYAREWSKSLGMQSEQYSAAVDGGLSRMMEHLSGNVGTLLAQQLSEDIEEDEDGDSNWVCLIFDEFGRGEGLNKVTEQSYGPWSRASVLPTSLASGSVVQHDKAGR